MLIKNRMIQTLLWTTLIMLSTATQIHSQETRPISFAEGSVKTQVAPTGEKQTNASRPTDCETELATANQRLLKALDALEFAEKAIEAQKLENAALRSLIQINEQIIQKKDSVIENQNVLIEKLNKQTRPELKIFWGLFKVRF